MIKLRSLVKMSFGNLKAYSWINFKMCLSFACLAFLICLFNIYNNSLTAKTKAMYEENISGNYFCSSSDKSQLLEEYGYTGYKSYTFGLLNLESKMKQVFNTTTALSCSTKYVTVSYNGKTYTQLEGKNAYSIRITPDNPFNPNDVRALRTIHGLNSPVKGAIPRNESEGAVSALVLSSYGLDPEEVLGKQLVFTINTDSAPLMTITVSGIIREEYYKLTGHSTSSAICPNFILHQDNPVFGMGKLSTRYVYYYNDWFNVDTDILKDLTYNQGCTYGALGVYGSIVNLGNIRQIANTLYTVIGSGLIVGLILTIYLMIDKYVRVYSRMSGILMTLGMRKRQVYALLLMQIVLICIIAVPLSVALTAVCYSIITSLVYRMTSIKLSSSVGQISAMLSLGLGAVILIASIFFTYLLLKLRKRSVKRLLNTLVD